MLTTRESVARSTSGFFAYQSIIKSALDWVFPPRCSGCGRVDSIWCDTCQDELSAVPIENNITEMPELLGVAATGTHVGKLQEAVQALKYDNVQLLAQILAQRLHECLAQLDWQFDIIAPVPLHDDRLKIRGYNQAGLLAEALAELQSIPYHPHAFQRVQFTRSQVGLNREQRLENVEAAFMADSQQVQDKLILLIDDVRTTGATLQACANAAKEVGASGVYALTVSVARG